MLLHLKLLLSVVILDFLFVCDLSLSLIRPLVVLLHLLGSDLGPVVFPFSVDEWARPQFKLPGTLCENFNCSSEAFNIRFDAFTQFVVFIDLIGFAFFKSQQICHVYSSNDIEALTKLVMNHHR